MPDELNGGHGRARFHHLTEEPLPRKRPAGRDDASLEIFAEGSGSASSEAPGLPPLIPDGEGRTITGTRSCRWCGESVLDLQTYDHDFVVHRSPVCDAYREFARERDQELITAYFEGAEVGAFRSRIAREPDARKMPRDLSIDGELFWAARTWQLRPRGPMTYADWLGETYDLHPETRGQQPNEQEERWARAHVWRQRFLWHWADSGFTTFTAAHSYAAALMSTDANEQHGDLLLPWRAVRIRVPAGLLPVAGKEVRSIYLLAELDGQLASLAYSDLSLEQFAILHHEQLLERQALFRQRMADTLADVLYYRTEDERSFLDGGAPIEDEQQRILLLCTNYVAGLLYTLQHTRDWKSRESRNNYGRYAFNGERRMPPTHRNVVIGRPIAVNLAAAVQALARGDSRRTSPVMFQSLVRGHYKRQVIGVGRGGRKVIWVEPYWRGPENAPMLARPYHFKTDEPS